MALTVLEYYGDLLDSDVDIIAHQCNVMSNNHRGLADVIFKTWPEANTYHKNPRPEAYGTVDLFPVPHRMLNKTIWIANMYCQMYPGKAIARQGNLKDTPEGRLEAFQLAFEDLNYERLQLGLRRIGFPYQFGSGLAGGDWKTYRDMIFILGEEHSRYEDLEIHIVALKAS